MAIDGQLLPPGMDGLDLLKRITTKYRDFPTLFITAYDNPDIESDAYRYGANAYLPKGEHEEIHWALRDLIARSRTKGVWRALGRLLHELGVSLSEVGEPTREALARMCTGLAQGLRRADWAKAAALPEPEFSEQFDRDMTLLPKAFVMRLQVETAIDLARESELDYSVIAARVGFGGFDNMYYVFKKLTKRRPSDFRPRKRKQG